LLATEDFQPPAALRVDNSLMVDANGARVRLPYLKLPRNPEFRR
jgi:hypothetical protein